MYLVVPKALPTPAGARLLDGGWPYRGRPRSRLATGGPARPVGRAGRPRFSAASRNACPLARAGRPVIALTSRPQRGRTFPALALAATSKVLGHRTDRRRWDLIRVPATEVCGRRQCCRSKIGVYRQPRCACAGQWGGGFVRGGVRLAGRRPSHRCYQKNRGAAVRAQERRLARARSPTNLGAAARPRVAGLVGGAAVVLGPRASWPATRHWPWPPALIGPARRFGAGHPGAGRRTSGCWARRLEALPPVACCPVARCGGRRPPAGAR